MLDALIVIFCCQLAGELLAASVGLPVPGPVLGMLILLAGLMVKGFVPQGLGDLADGLLTNLSLLFVPAGVGVMLHGPLIGRDWVALTVALVASTAVSIGVTGVLMQRLLKAKPDKPAP